MCTTQSHHRKESDNVPADARPHQLTSTVSVTSRSTLNCRAAWKAPRPPDGAPRPPDGFKSPSATRATQTSDSSKASTLVSRVEASRPTQKSRKGDFGDKNAPTATTTKTNGTAAACCMARHWAFAAARTSVFVRFERAGPSYATTHPTASKPNSFATASSSSPKHATSAVAAPPPPRP
ncbi:hypothetical protein M885DRAFT_310699 [Pelagophyceae sp. CCMP2097]|nr:hypothetical protein M885DRAFT_310699 [Pelagophyceae sp. CCMP2097]